MSNIGIMQGRLSPPEGELIQWYPVDTWESEFYLANEIGLVCIEWVFQKSTASKNLISTDLGINKILEISDKSGVEVLSVTADYYMEDNLISENGQINKDTLTHLEWLIIQSKKLGVKYVMTPFVDASSLKNPEQQEGLLIFLKTIIPVLEKHKIELHMETDLHTLMYMTCLYI